MGMGSARGSTFTTITSCEAATIQCSRMDKPATLQTDSSSTGLGAVLMQDDKPVINASRTLSSTEREYSQIEKECLGIVFGCERFYQYLYAKDIVLVETDHKPLEIILKNLYYQPLRDCNACCQDYKVST